MKPGTTMPGLRSQVAAAAQRLPLLGWCLAATLAVIVLQLVADSRSLFDTLGDSDDATRLIQVRAFLANTAWFDTTLDAFAGNSPLRSHWSRIIDAPLAALIATFQLFVDQSMAEFATRILWPALLLLALSYVVARMSEVEAGRPAAMAALVLLLGAFLATTQFWVGRIDHHSALLLTSITGVLLLARSFSKPSLARPAGIALALSLAIGFESLALVATALVAFVVVAGLLSRNEDIAKTAAFAFAATVTVAFFATVPPSRWLVASCDSLSINLTVLSGLAAVGVGLVLTKTIAEQLRLRLMLLAIVGFSSLGLALALEPRCITGPFGQVDPRLHALWLDYVAETQNISWLWQRLPAIAITYVISSVLGITAAIWLARQTPTPAALYMLAVVTLIALIGLLQVKLIPYAAVLTVPPLAIAIARLPKWPPLTRTATQVIALLLSMQIIISLAAHAIIGVPDKTHNELRADKACRTHDAIQPLHSLAPGLMVSDLNIASAIVAASKLKAFAAPYHRLGPQIRTTAEIFESNARDSYRYLNDVGATYVVICNEQSGGNLSGLKLHLTEKSLRSRLTAGAAPDFLTRLTLTAPTPIQVWQFKPRRNETP